MEGEEEWGWLRVAALSKLPFPQGYFWCVTPFPHLIFFFWRREGYRNNLLPWPLLLLLWGRMERGSWPVYLLYAHSKNELQRCDPAKISSCFSLPLFSSLLLLPFWHWCFCLLFLPCVLWMPRAHAHTCSHQSHQWWQQAEAGVGATGCASGWPFSAAAELISWLRFLHPAHYSWGCAAHWVGQHPPPSDVLKTILLQVAAPHIPACSMQEQGNA